MAMISKLTPEALRSLIERHGTGEDPLVDYKRAYQCGTKAQRAGIEIVKDVCAMANSAKRRDGLILFGVDGAGKVLGVTAEALSKFDDNQPQQLIKACVEPPPEVLFYPVELDGKTIIVAHVGASAQLYAIAQDCIPAPGENGRSLHEGQVYHRQGTRSVPAKASEVMRLVRHGHATEAVLDQVAASMGLTRLIQRMIRLTMTRRLFWSTEERDCVWLSVANERVIGDESQMIVFKLNKSWWLPDDRYAHLPTITLYVFVEDRGETKTTKLFSLAPIPDDAESVLSQGHAYRMAFALTECTCALGDSRKERTPEVLDPSTIQALYEGSEGLYAAEDVLRQIEKKMWW